jgi:hypothetical protein
MINLPGKGLLADFFALKQFSPLLSQLEHQLMGDISTEYLLQWQLGLQAPLSGI